MVLYIDSNVLLDVLQIRLPHYDYSYLVWKLCEKGYASGFISALTFANIVYVMRKDLKNDNKVDGLLQKLSIAFSFTDLLVSDINTASKTGWKDFEDAVQSAIAERINADYIITRNVKDFQDGKIKAVTPEEFFLNVFNIDEN